MSEAELPQETRLNERTFQLISYGLVVLMMTCAALTVVSLINDIFPSWDPKYIAVLCLFVSFECLYLHGTFERLTFLSSNWFKVHIANWIFILVVVKLTVGLSHGLESFTTEIWLWEKDFLVYFLNGEFLLVFALTVMAWLLSNSFAELIDEMGVAHAKILQDSGPDGGPNRPPVRERVMNLVFGIGIVQLIITALIRIDFRALSAPASQPFLKQLPAFSGGGSSTLIYFMLGLALISQTRFIELHTRWALRKIPVSGGIPQRWGLYSLLLLGILILVGSILPTNYTLGFFFATGSLIEIFSKAVFTLIQLIISLIIFLASLPFLLFGHMPPIQQAPPQPLTPPPVVKAANVPVSPLDILKAFLFWAVMVMVTYFSIVQFLRQHRELTESLRKFPAWKFLSSVLAWLRSLWGAVTSNVLMALQTSLSRLRSIQKPTRSPEGLGWLNLRRLNPRQQITFYYLALVRRGEESGYPRRPSQTPGEYSENLENEFPDIKEDIDSLTKTFILARYSPHAPDRKNAKQAKTDWQHIRKAFIRKE